MMVGIVIIAALAAPACFYMIFSSTTEWCCLQEGEIFEYKIKKEGMKNGTLNIFIKDGKSQEIKSKITIDDIRTSAYPVELRKCGAYYVKLFNYDSINAEKEKGYRSELTVHDYGNNEKKLICQEHAAGSKIVTNSTIWIDLSVANIFFTTGWKSREPKIIQGGFSCKNVTNYNFDQKKTNILFISHARFPYLMEFIAF